MSADLEDYKQLQSSISELRTRLHDVNEKKEEFKQGLKQGEVPSEAELTALADSLDELGEAANHLVAADLILKEMKAGQNVNIVSVNLEARAVKEHLRRTLEHIKKAENIINLKQKSPE